VYEESLMNNRQTGELQGLDLRHIGRLHDKEMPVDQPGMQMSKPGLADLRRRRHPVAWPTAVEEPGPLNPPPTDH
jgi:hypothetical protein